MKIEFKIGDKVTFYPYEKEVPAVVVEIVHPYKVCFDRNDTRVFYRLSGIDKKKPLASITTGNSIKESRYFRTFTDED